eukprot:GDKI01015987.1.p1 GENE.GDKI01015987.1~~GDKI01015987.1.p1  ORF type:complete len:119 (-),score=30.90 GDKI01015987.1:43-399(-)
MFGANWGQNTNTCKDTYIHTRKHMRSHVQWGHSGFISDTHIVRNTHVRTNTRTWGQHGCNTHNTVYTAHATHTHVCIIGPVWVSSVRNQVGCAHTHTHTQTKHRLELSIGWGKSNAVV